MTTPQMLKCKTARRGFSLVEVCLALGMVSFSLLSMIAMLPTGLGALRDSKDQMLCARILQQVCGDLQTAEYGAAKNDDSVSGTRLYFDADGQQLGKTDADGRARYVVELSSESPSLPGLKDALVNHLQRVRVGISKANTPDNSVKWYAIQIAKP